MNFEKEYWLGRGRTIDVPFVMGVGGAIDVVAGITQRAPTLLQRMGLEWGVPPRPRAAAPLVSLRG
jgi:UDP-N-acetyl-D-mannosaminuronic acid transferase (WecB/TagA/CpsF family)